MDHTKQFNHLSLCAGYGGIDLGLSRALGNTRTVCFVEIEAFNIENLVAKIEAGLLDPAPIYSNLKTFPFELLQGRVDIVSGGFPCQPFSAAGRRAGDDDPRHLWPFIVDGLRRMGRPPLVFFENVEGIISSRLNGDQWSDPEKTPVLLHVLRELERLGYKSTAGTFSAAEIGAPHQRKRVFILGVRNDLKKSGLDLIARSIKSKLMANTGGKSKRAGARLDNESGRSLERRRAGISPRRFVQNDDPRSTGRRDTAYPKGRGLDQYNWEPPRTILFDADGGSSGKVQWRNRGVLLEPTCEKKTNRSTRASHPIRANGQTKSSVGRDANGASNRMDFAELYQSCDSRIDELRSLGNGVVPDTAAKAFRILFEELNQFS